MKISIITFVLFYLCVTFQLLTFADETNIYDSTIKYKIMNDNLLKSFAEAVLPYILPYVENKIKDQLQDVPRKKNEEPELIPRKTAMNRFSISEATLWRWEQSGKLIPVRFGRKVLYRVSDILNVLK